MTAGAELLAPMGVLSGAPPIPGRWRPADGDNWLVPGAVLAMGGETSGVVGDDDNAGEAEEAVAALDPGGGPERAGPTPGLGLFGLGIAGTCICAEQGSVSALSATSRPTNGIILDCCLMAPQRHTILAPQPPAL
jgi:hypothetical protein